MEGPGKIKHSRPVPPFLRWCSATIPAAFDDSLTYYEALCSLWKWLQTNLVEVVNNNATVTQEYIRMVDELKEYVENYFENLDVQEEINNKLDQMAESGQLQEIISAYLNSKAVFGFDKLEDMTEAENLIDGSYARTLGKSTFNDGYGELYKIKTKTPADVVDGDNVVAMEDDSLVAIKYLGEKYPENVILKTDYINDAPIYITELHNVQEIKVKPTAPTLAQYVLSTNVLDYDRANSEFDIFMNAGVGDTNNHVKPLGWVLTDTEQMQNAAVSYSGITAIKADGTVDNFSLSTYSDIDEMKGAGYVNCVTAYDALIRNNAVVTPNAPYRDNVNLFGQLESGDLVLFQTHGRILNVQDNMTWQQIGDFILSKYPTMRIVTIMDGGGSVQLYNKDSTLIPNTSRTDGRIVSTIFAIKIKKGL